MAMQTGMQATVKIGSVEPNIQMKESFSDVIYNLSPTDTPFQSMCKKESINAIEIGWFVDQLAKAQMPTGIAEGADAQTNTYEVVERMMNLTQIFQNSVRVTKTAEAVDFYGRKSEMAYQMTKKAQELKRDIEATLCGVKRQAQGGFWSSLVGNATTTSIGGTPPITNATTGVRVFSNYKWLINQNPFPNEPAALPAGQGRTVVKAGGIFEEKDLNALMEKMWQFGGEAKTALVNSKVAQAIAGFALTGGSTGGAARYRDIGQEKKLVNVVDVYVTPFGEIKIGLSRWLNINEAADGGAPGTATGTGGNNDIFLLDPKYISLAYLRQPFKTDLPTTKDAEEKTLTSELTFKLTAPDGCGLLTDITFLP
jgi:hypothetical protein